MKKENCITAIGTLFTKKNTNGIFTRNARLFKTKNSFVPFVLSFVLKMNVKPLGDKSQWHVDVKRATTELTSKRKKKKNPFVSPSDFDVNT